MNFFDVPYFLHLGNLVYTAEELSETPTKMATPYTVVATAEQACKLLART